MIHAWLICRRIKEANGGHGRRFIAKCAEINSSTIPDFLRPYGGYNITVYHTMHEEVRFYQQHHWRCKLCKVLIRRAMNRKPQPADCRHYSRFRGMDCGDLQCGHHKHVRACNGEFEKIKEPEGFSDKKKKKRKIKEGDVEGATERPNKRKDNGKAITDFFRGGEDTQPPGYRDGQITEGQTTSSVARDRIKEEEARKNFWSIIEARTKKQETPPASRKAKAEAVPERDSQYVDLTTGQEGICGDGVVPEQPESKGPLDAFLKGVDSSLIGDYKCPSCGRRLRGVMMSEFNRHLDACLNDGVIVLE